MKTTNYIYLKDEVNTLLSNSIYDHTTNSVEQLLIWMLAQRIKNKELDSQAGINLLKLPQKQIAGKINLNQQAFSLLKKIHIDLFDQENFELLLKLFQFNYFPKYLHHAKCIALKYLFDNDIKVNINSNIAKVIFLNSNYNEQKIRFKYFKDSLKLMNELNLEPFIKKIYSIKSPAKLSTLHDDLFNEINKLDEYLEDKQRSYGVFFPPPPLRGNKHIEYISNIYDLKDEAIQMRNCVLGFSTEAYRGECYFYRVLQPERCTLQISKHKDQYYIDDFKTIDNNEPQAASKYYIKNWVDGCILEW